MELTDAVVLENAFVRLEPLSTQHADDLATASAGLELAWYTSAPQPADVDDDIIRRLRWRDEGHMNPWAVVVDGRAVGETTFCNIEAEDRRVEIGYTWLSPSVHRTAVNSAAKRLLLAHAFETCEAIAVEFRTHWHNRRSRAAIERLGAKQDGVLRNHRVGADGVVRDTVVCSILPTEWPAVRRGLDAALAR